MNDADLNTLVRLALEAERLEHSAADAEGVSPDEIDSVLHLAGGDGTDDDAYAAWSSRLASRRRWALVGGLACAAVLTLAGVVPLLANRFSPLSPAPIGPLAIAPVVVPHTPAEPVHAADHAAPRVALAVTPDWTAGFVNARGEPSVVLAVYQDDDERAFFTDPGLIDWNCRRSLADVGSTDLLHSILASPSVTNPDRVLVVAVSGPADFLPRTEHERDAMLACLTEWGDGEYGDAAAEDAPAPGRVCLPGGLRVIAEAMSLVGR